MPARQVHAGIPASSCQPVCTLLVPDVEQDVQLREAGGFLRQFGLLGKRLLQFCLGRLALLKGVFDGVLCLLDALGQPVQHMVDADKVPLGVLPKFYAVLCGALQYGLIAE